MDFYALQPTHVRHEQVSPGLFLSYTNVLPSLMLGFDNVGIASKYLSTEPNVM